MLTMLIRQHGSSRCYRYKIVHEIVHDNGRMLDLKARKGAS